MINCKAFAIEMGRKTHSADNIALRKYMKGKRDLGGSVDMQSGTANPETDLKEKMDSVDGVDSESHFQRAEG